LWLSLKFRVALGWHYVRSDGPYVNGSRQILVLKIISKVRLWTYKIDFVLSHRRGKCHFLKSKNISSVSKNFFQFRKLVFKVLVRRRNSHIYTNILASLSNQLCKYIRNNYAVTFRKRNYLLNKQATSVHVQLITYLWKDKSWKFAIWFIKYNW